MNPHTDSPRAAATPATRITAELAPSPATGARSKTVAAWLALLLGTLGLHRLYLHGPGDVLLWLHPLPTLAGLVGVARLLNLGQDDPWAWALIPLLGLMISMAMLSAIVYALTPDERWDARYNAGIPSSPTGWAAILAAVLALLLGGVVLTGTIAYGGQKFFEWQLQTAGSSLHLGTVAAAYNNQRPNT